MADPRSPYNPITLNCVEFQLEFRGFQTAWNLQNLVVSKLRGIPARILWFPNCVEFQLEFYAVCMLQNLVVSTLRGIPARNVVRKCCEELFEK